MYANLCIFSNNGEMETLDIIVKELLFDTKFSSVILYMNGVWPDEIEVSLEGAKNVVVETDSNLSKFGPRSLCFEHHILAHIQPLSFIGRDL